MALVDDLKDDIALNNTPTTVIKEKRNVAILGETHAFLKTTDSEIRTKASVPDGRRHHPIDIAGRQKAGNHRGRSHLDQQQGEPPVVSQ